MPKQPIYQQLDSATTDTVYGIINEGAIPIRTTNTTFKEEVLVEKQYDPNIITQSVLNWEILILLFIIVLVGLSKAFSNNRFKQGIKALFSYTVAQETVREEKVFFHRFNLLLSIVHILATTLFIYRIKDVLHIGELGANNFLFFLLLLALVLFTYTVKYLFSKALMFVFDDANIAHEYIFTVSLYNNLLGALFIPTLCLLYFTSISFVSILLYIALPLTLFSFILRGLRLTTIGILRGISYFYIFLYICTLEILPLVVLYKIFILK